MNYTNKILTNEGNETKYYVTASNETTMIYEGIISITRLSLETVGVSRSGYNHMIKRDYDSIEVIYVDEANVKFAKYGIRID